jgi:hypothetical protein
MSRYATLFLTHSGRVTDLKLCSLNYLTRRYASPHRLKTLPSFNELQPASMSNSYNGMISIFHLDRNASENCISCAGTIHDERKIQHVVKRTEKELVVAYEDGLELWEFPCPVYELDRKSMSKVKKRAVYEHGLFAGIHTAFLADVDTVILSCSAPDAVLKYDLREGKLINMLRMPELIYGHNYEITEHTNLKSHYIYNDVQTTHINSAWPDGNGKIIVSTLIQGAIGVFDELDSDYHELTRGFVGCHGVRRSREGLIYFADSVTGNLIFLNDNGRIHSRYAVDSRWLHDVQQIEGDQYAFSLADKNELRICDIKQDRVLFQKKYPVIPDSRINILRNKTGIWRGNSTQFLSVSLVI